MQVINHSALFAFLTFCFGSGCNSQPPAAVSNQQTVAVKGTVTLKGQPLAKGTISFEPDNGGREANGNIEAGAFSLTTFVKDDGAIAGLHRVAVRGALGGKKDPVPLKYQNYSSSGITIEVKADQSEYKIELK
ncbi:MAG: hypothetical protein ACKO0V_07745 [bacterium]